MPEYTVSWIIQVDAETPRRAAQEAAKMLKDAIDEPMGASVLIVEDEMGKRYGFDEWGEGTQID